MNFFDYFKLINRNKLLIVIITLISTGAGYFFSQSLNKTPYGATLFLTLGIQENIGKTSSAYENLQAADQITESIQGWFKDPSLLNEINKNTNINTSIQAKKQEKENIMVNFSATDEASANLISNQIIDSLSKRINQYNAHTDIKISLATDNLDISHQSGKNNITIFLGLIIGLILGLLGSFLWEQLNQFITSSKHLRTITNRKIIADFSSEKSFKNKFHFLCKYLNDKYGKKSFQIIDLTHKNKFGLETISKNTDLVNIITLKLPQDYLRLNIKTPTLIIVEIGHTKTATITELDNLPFDNLDIISIQKISN